MSAPTEASASQSLSSDERDRLADAPVAEVLGFVEQRFGERAAVACSFGVEDIALLHLCRQHAPSVRFFTLDTGRLPEATYELIDTVRRRLDVVIEPFFPAAAAARQLTREKGFFSFKTSIENRQECCRIRKVEPLKRAVAGRSAWLTGLRRAQSVTRNAVDVAAFDAGNGLWKFNPLSSWSTEQTWAYVKEHKLPWNRLHDEGFPSIGCAPCTRAVAAGEDERAGRWWWESPDHKECGLHVAKLG